MQIVSELANPVSKNSTNKSKLLTTVLTSIILSWMVKASVKYST